MNDDRYHQIMGQLGSIRNTFDDLHKASIRAAGLEGPEDQLDSIKQNIKTAAECLQKVERKLAAELGAIASDTKL